MSDLYKCSVCGNDKYQPFLNGEFAECTKCLVVTQYVPGGDKQKALEAQQAKETSE